MLDGFRPSAMAFSPRLVNLAGAGDVSLFWEALVGLIGESIAFHTAFLWYDYVDFASSSKSTLVLESPRRDRPAEYWELRRRCHLTPAYLQAHPGLKLHRLSDIAPAEALRKTEFYQKFMRPEGWEYGLTLSFWQQEEVRATLVLYRTPEQGDFTPDILGSLQNLHPLIQAVLFRLIHQQQQQVLQAGMEEFLRGLPVGLILLNWDLRPVLVNDEGYQQALLWNHGQGNQQRDPRAQFQVPLELRKVCERFPAVVARRTRSGAAAAPAPGGAFASREATAVARDREHAARAKRVALSADIPDPLRRRSRKCAAAGCAH